MENSFPQNSRIQLRLYGRRGCVRGGRGAVCGPAAGERVRRRAPWSGRLRVEHAATRKSRAAAPPRPRLKVRAGPLPWPLTAGRAHVRRGGPARCGVGVLRASLARHCEDASDRGFRDSLMGHPAFGFGVAPGGPGRANATPRGAGHGCQSTWDLGGAPVSSRAANYDAPLPQRAPTNPPTPWYGPLP